MKKIKTKISNSNNGKADSLFLLLKRAIGKLFRILFSFDEISLSRCFVDCLPIVSRLFVDCLSVASRCKLGVSSVKARLNKSCKIPEFISSIPMGYIKMVPQYMPRAPDG